MKRLPFASLICLLLSAVQVAPATAAETVRVFAASSLTGALSEIAARYKSQQGVQISTVFASSSTLAKQIINGAPADIYISANPDWMDRVERSGTLAPGSRQLLLANRLSLIAPSTEGTSVDLSQPNSIVHALKGGRLAMGDPDHVPAGMYAKAALTSWGRWQALKGRIAAAPDARAALAYVERGEVSLGIVYASDVVGRSRVTEVLKFPENSHPPILYPMALISGNDEPAVQQVFRFLQSDDARVIFSRHGFSKP